MKRSITDGERFLLDYHRRHRAVTPLLLGNGQTADGRSSYQVLAELAEGRNRVLDLACGDGELSALLTAHGRSVTGLDMSDAELADARRRPELAGTGFVLGRAQELPFAANSFDACLSHMAFMLLTDPAGVALELGRVLAPGGLFAIVTGGPSTEGARVVFRTVLLELLGTLSAEYRLPHIGDRRVLTKEGLDDILGPAGFAPVTTWRLAIDKSGTVDEAWRAAASVYDVDLLDRDMLAELRGRFEAEVGAVTNPDGTVPFTIVLNVATTTLSPAV